MAKAKNKSNTTGASTPMAKLRGKKETFRGKNNSPRVHLKDVAQQQKTTSVTKGNTWKRAGNIQGRRTRSSLDDQLKQSSSNKLKVNTGKPSPSQKYPQSPGEQSSKIMGSKRGKIEKPFTPSPVKKTRHSIKSQSNLTDIAKTKIVVDAASHSPRKKRLQSFDRQSESVSAPDLAKPSPAKKTRNSTDQTSHKLAPITKEIDSSKSQKRSQRSIKASSQRTTPDGGKRQTDLVRRNSRKRTPTSITNKSEKITPQTQKTETMKSTPESLYDFTTDSPKPDDDSSVSVKGSKVSKTVSKNTKIASNSDASKKSKPVGKKTRLRKEIDPSLITPKTRRCRVVLKALDQNKPATKKIKVKVDIHSQSSVDSVSPVLPDTSQKNKQSKKVSGKSKTRVCNVNKGKTRKVRPDKESNDVPIPKMPSVSFLDTEIFSEPYEDDSAIFLSPKMKKPSTNKVKPQTPLPVGIVKDKRISSIECSFNVENIKSTSTPNPEPKIDGDPIRDHILVSSDPKLNQPEFSPVKRVETPATSDYGSMNSFVSPTPQKVREREHSPSPAFSLDDDKDTLSLNRSTEKSYKRSKKKFQKGRYSIAKEEQWIEKMNSEIEDIENFELSVEG